MQKIAIAAGVALAVFAGVASAQVYYPNSSYVSAQNSCASISGTLSTGSRGAQVSALQQFLVSQNYSGGGSWMVTGYYGEATAAAMRIFQQAHGLPATGALDSATLAAMNCGGSYAQNPSYAPYSYNYNQSYTYPYSYQNYSYLPSGQTGYPNWYNNNYNYGYNSGYPYNYNYYTTPTITSLSQNTGFPGNTITIYGQGFDYANNTVSFGGQSYYGIPSQNGTSLTFTIPYLNLYNSGVNQTVQLSVGTSRGMSNSLTFTMNPSTSYNYNYNYGCGNNWYSNCGNCGYPYSYGYNYCSGCGSYNCGGNTNAPAILYLNPQSGGVGTVVTVYGNGFTTGNNTVHFGNGIVTGLQSPDGQSVSFTVPSQITGYGSQPVVIGTYQVSVTNGNGVTTNTLPFTVTSTISGSGAPVISSVTGPTSLSTGTQGTWGMTVSAQGNSYATISVNWGDTNAYYQNAAAPQTIYNGSQNVSFTHTYFTPGTYTIVFTASNAYGQSNSYTTTITVSGSAGYGMPVISSISPSSGYIGQQVTIYGSNFRQGDTINFGAGAIQNVYTNGSAITFTVPSAVGPYCQSGYACPQYVIPVTPGTYNVSVMDSYGTSNSVTFTVIQ